MPTLLARRAANQGKNHPETARNTAFLMRMLSLSLFRSQSTIPKINNTKTKIANGAICHILLSLHLR